MGSSISSSHHAEGCWHTGGLTAAYLQGMGPGRGGTPCPAVCLRSTPQHATKDEARAPAGTAPHSPGLENRYNACSCTMSAHAGGSVPVSELLATASEVSCTKVLHAGGSGPVRELEVQGEKLQRHHCTPCRGH